MATSYSIPWFNNPDYIKEEEAEKKKADEFDRRFKQDLKRARDKSPSALAKKVRETAIRKGGAKAVSGGRITKEEAVNRLRDPEVQKKIQMSAADGGEKADFDEFSGEKLYSFSRRGGGRGRGPSPFELAEMTGRAGESLAFDDPSIAGKKGDAGEKRDTLMGGGRGRGPTVFELAEMTGRAGEKKETLMGGGRGFLSEYDKARLANRAGSSMDFIKKEAKTDGAESIFSGEKRDTLMGGGRGRGPTDFEMAEMTGRAGESIPFEEFVYNKEMEGTTEGQGSRQIKEMELGRGTPRYRSIEEQDLEVDEALDAEGVPPGPERARVKEQLGNYFVDPVTGYAINLDKLNASIRSEAKRKKMLSTANLLTGKARVEFMKNKGLISEKDIPPKTETEKLKEQLDFVDTKVKLAEALERGKNIGKKKQTEKQKQMYEIGMQAMKDGNMDVATAAFKKAGLDNVPDLKVSGAKATEALFKLPGGSIDMTPYVGVAGKDGANIGKFMEKYWEERGKISAAISVFKYGNPGGLSVDEKTKMIPYFNNAGVPMWDNIPGKGEGGVVNDLSFINDVGLRRQLEDLIPKGGWKDEVDYLQSVNDVVFNRALDQRFGKFHDEYTKKSENATLISEDRNSGGGDDTGGQGAGGVEEPRNFQRTSNPLEATGFIESNLPKNVARENENVEEEPLSADETTPLLSEIQQYMSSGGSIGQGGGGGETQVDEGGINIIPEVEASTTDKGMTLMVRDANGNVDARQSTERTQNFFYTIDNEGSARLTPTEERYENKKLVKQNGKSVYHIGHGTKLPLTPEEVSLVRQSVNLTDSQAKQLRSTKPNPDILKKIKITEDVADLLGKSRYRDHVAKLQKANGTDFMNYDPRIRRVVFDMAYNLGPNFMTRKKDAFKDFRKALINNDVEGMIKEIKDSTYFKSQNPNRAKKNIQILEELL